jgi:hypothetical protein
VSVDPSEVLHLEREATRLLAAAEPRALTMRLIGGMAIRLLLGDALHPAFHREIQDLDFVLAPADARHASPFFSEAGYVPDRAFNGLSGGRRMLFVHPETSRQIDVFVGTFEMCHTLPLEGRLKCLPLTLPSADLLLTKLQIVELNQKDCYDIFALVLAHPLAEHDDGTVNLDRIVSLTSRDWGLHHTVSLNLERLRQLLPAVGIDEEARQEITARLAALGEALERAPKSRAWKMRARIGERKQWYEEPEEVDRG